MRPMMKLAIAVLFVSGAAATLWGQGSTAQMNGAVHDPTGAAVPGAEVKATQTGTGAVRTTTTGADGAWVLPNLTIGPYQLAITKMGFSEYIQTGIVLQVDSNPTIDTALRVGAVTDTIKVEADAALVETHSTGVGTVVDQQRVVDLPLNGRQATQLIFLSGMATTGNGTNLNTIRNYPTQLISVAGGQGNGITYLLDGGMHNDVMNNLNLPTPFPDALQEFKVESSALPAQYGLHASAAVNAVTKSGTNEFHGDAFEFFRNGDMNARDFFAAARDSIKRNQYGGTVGGPIKHNKLFFFAGYQGSKLRSDPAASYAFLPTPQALGGDWTTLAGPQCNNGRQVNLPASQGFTNNTIAPSRYNPVALKVLTLIPTPTTPCGVETYGVLSDSNESIGVTRVDYQINDKHTIFARYIIADLRGPGAYDGKNALTFAEATTSYRDQALVIGDTYLFGSNIVNSFRLTGTRTAVQKVPDKFFTWKDLGVQGTYPLIPAISRLTVGGGGGTSAAGTGFGYGSANESPSEFNTGPSYAAGNDVSWVHGNHQFGFGGNYIFAKMNLISGLNAVGVMSFNGSVTGLADADFMIGSASAWNQASFSVGYNRQNYIGLYAQDFWKMTSRLTVSYGVRWEPYIAPYSTRGQFLSFQPSLFGSNAHSTVYPNAPAGMIFPGDPQYTAGNGPENSTYNRIVPRIGMVWDPMGDGKMTIRASYGMFTDRQHLFYLDAFANDTPYGDNVTLSNVNMSNPWATYPGGNPFPIVLTKNSTFPVASAIVTHQLNDNKPTYLNQWNFSVQRQIGVNWLISANYVGNNTVHLWTGNQANPAIFLGTGPCTLNIVNAAGVVQPTPQSVCSTTANTNQRRLYYLQNPQQGQYYAGITQQDTGGTANYNALYFAVQRRLARGVSIQGNYTWSHCLSDVQNTELGTAGPLYSIPFNRTADHSNCALSDQRQVLNISALAQMPKFSNKALNMLASGWQLSTIISAKSAQIFTVTSGLDNALNGQTTERPNQVLSNVYTSGQGPTYWLNPSAFVQTPLGAYGNLGAANMAGPSILQVDMAVLRVFPIREKKSLQFRAEAFNVINTVNFTTPVAALNASNFGQITSDIAANNAGGLLATGGDPRVLQLALKFLF